jgi:DNA-binding IclR family transcriptional regulator
VAAVDRALLILDCFTGVTPILTLAQLSAATGLYKSTILRIVASLIRGRLVERMADGKYRIGAAVFRLGTLYRQSVTPEALLMPIMRELVAETGENAVFYVPAEEGMRICLYRVESETHAVRLHIREGHKVEIGRGAPGHVLLAFSGREGALYDKIRQDRVHAVMGDREPDIGGIAAPVFGGDDALIGALAVIGPVSRMNAAFVDRVTGLVRTLADRVSEALGASSGGPRQQSRGVRP